MERHSLKPLRYYVSLLLAVLSTSILLAGCGMTRSLSPRDSSELPLMLEALEGKDPLILSEENEHLAPNRLVFLLREESGALRGFFSQRGIPDAVRVVDASDEASEIDLYYLSPDELFRIEQEKTVWVVLGPTQIQREFLIPLKRSIRKSIVSKEMSSPTETPEEDYTGIDAAESEMTGNQITERDVVDSSSLREEVLTLANEPSTPQAEKNVKGDILHRVITRQENILILSLWYTLNTETASSIARINSKDARAPLEPGDTIQIPSYLVKNVRALEAGNTAKLAELLER